MNVVILAAGFGSRFKDMTKEKGKALIEVFNKPLIDYALRFSDSNQVEQRIVIGGFTFDKLRSHLNKINPERLILLENKMYDKGSILTLNTARNYLNNGFLMMNVDHIYAPEMFEKILQTKNEGIFAVVDSARKIVEDDMKVKRDSSGKILGIDKRLKEYDAGYIGMTLVSKACAVDYLKALDEVLQIKGEGAVVEPILQHLAEKKYPIHSIDIAGLPWCEMNTQEEKIEGEAMLLNQKKLFSKYF